MSLERKYILLFLSILIITAFTSNLYPSFSVMFLLVATGFLVYKRNNEIKETGATTATINTNLISCSDCEAVISTNAKSCPHCGAPVIKKKEKTNYSRIFYGVLFSSVLIILIASLPNPRSSNGQTQENVPARDPLTAQFSSWDGSHPALVEYVKKNMKNPDSFEHVETKFGWVNDPKYNQHERILVHMIYRGSNSFGGVITEEVFAHVDTHGNVLEVVR